MKRTKRLARNFALVALLSSSGISQTTWYVDVNNAPPGSGTLGDPYVSIAAAHDALTTLAGDTLQVAPGTYVEGTLDLIKRISVVSTGGPQQTFLRETFVTMGSFNVSPDLPLLHGFTVSHSATDLPVSTRLVDVRTGTLRRCILRDTHFTALFIDQEAVVRETTIAGNLRAMAGFVLAWRIDMRNSIIWGNTLGVDEFGNDGDCVSYSAGRPPTLQYFCDSIGNVNGDPGFWSLALGDYRLRPDSPCIDSGAPSSPNDPDGSRIDMGALTYDPGYVPGAYSFCEAAEHSAGSGAYMSMAGERSLTANTFTLVTESCPPNKIGLYFYGPNEIQVAFGDGFRCIGGSTTRVYPALFADGAGTATRPLDFTLPPANAGSGAISAGSTWKFQFWYRDPMGPGGTGFNVSDGLSVTFEP